VGLSKQLPVSLLFVLNWHLLIKELVEQFPLSYELDMAILQLLPQTEGISLF
jgi:hypothetical protein